MNWTEEEYAAYLKKQGKPVEVPKKSKYGNKKTNGYDSKHESDIAAELHLEAKVNKSTVLEQVRFPLVGCDYIADFVVLKADMTYEVIDAKGFKTDVYKLKKKMMKEVKNIEVIEV